MHRPLIMQAWRIRGRKCRRYSSAAFKLVGRECALQLSRLRRVPKSKLTDGFLSLSV